MNGLVEVRSRNTSTLEATHEWLHPIKNKKDHRVSKRVGVFIDGQNITIGARQAFKGNGNMHPLLLAQALAGANKLVEVRYATGIPDPEVDPDRAASERQRHELMTQTGVDVLERKLRYRSVWEIKDRDLPHPRGREGEVRQARVKAYNRGQEKGVDVWLALDALCMCSKSTIDIAIIASADRDMDMIPSYLKNLAGQEGTTVIAAKVARDEADVSNNDNYDGTILIDGEMYASTRDTFDYDQPLDDGPVSAFLDSLGRHDGTPST